MKKKNKRWTAEDENYLKSKYLSTEVSEMAEHLGRSNSAVKAKANILGLKKRHTFKEKREEVLKLALEGANAKEISEQVGIGKYSILEYAKKNEIKIKKEDRFRTSQTLLKEFEELPPGEVDYSELTVGEWFKRWYHAYRREDIRETTRQKYRNTYCHLEEHGIANKKLKETTREHIQSHINAYGSTRSKQTVLDHMQHIRSCFKDAVLDGHIKQNPAANTKPIFREQKLNVMELKEIRDKKKWLETDEYQKFRYYLMFWLQRELKNVPIYRISEQEQREHGIAYQVLYTLIFVALKTGVRLSEGLGITKADILFDSSEINIDKTWDYKGNEDGSFNSTKNIASIRRIAVDKETMDILSSYVEWLETFDYKTKENTLFISSGKLFHNSTANDALKRIFKELDIEPITMHKLRHTQASYLIAKGVPLQVVAKRLGHTDTNMIQRVYGHLLEETEERGNKMILELI